MGAKPRTGVPKSGGHRKRRAAAFVNTPAITLGLATDGPLQPTPSIAVALEEARTRLQALFDHSQDGILFADNDARFVDANPAACALLGRRRDQVVGRTVWEITPERLQARGKELWGAFLADGRQSGEYVLLRGDGTEVAIEYYAVANIRSGLHLSVLRDIAGRKKVEAELHRANRQLQTLSQRLLKAQEQERRHIARELHDEIGQLLTALSVRLEMCARSANEAVAADLENARALASELTSRVRSLSLDLRPAMLDDLGLLPALHWQFERFAAQTGVKVDFKHAGLEGRRFCPEIEIGAYRVVQEALTNVARHAEVVEATVRVWANDDMLHVQVEDRGKGFDTAIFRVGAESGGLTGMRERTSLLGGDLTLESSAGHGTKLTAGFALNASGIRSAQ